MRRRHVSGEQLRRYYEQGDPKRHGNNNENHPEDRPWVWQQGRKIRNPENSGYPADIRRGISDFPALYPPLILTDVVLLCFFACHTYS